MTNIRLIVSIRGNLTNNDWGKLKVTEFELELWDSTSRKKYGKISWSKREWDGYEHPQLEVERMIFEILKLAPFNLRDGDTYEIVEFTKIYEHGAIQSFNKNMDGIAIAIEILKKSRNIIGRYH